MTPYVKKERKKHGRIFKRRKTKKAYINLVYLKNGSKNYIGDPYTVGVYTQLSCFFSPFLEYIHI